MKLLLVNHQDNKDINAFSGTSYHMSQEIKRQFDVGDFYSIEQDSMFQSVYMNVIDSELRLIGESLNNYLNQSDIDYDVVLCQGGNSSIPFYNKTKPIVFWHDSTWHTYLRAYKSIESFNEFKTNYRNLYLWDSAVLNRADLLVYSSDYVAEACIKDYGLNEKKVKVIPFGANISNPVSGTQLDELIKERMQEKTINFTFIGKDWMRKGLKTAFALLVSLAKKGFPVRLNILGAKFEDNKFKSVPFVVDWGLLDKGDPTQQALFESIMKKTHFLIHPATAEPYGIALCEANAFGIPVFGTAVEGLKTVIKHNVNGYLFNETTFSKEAEPVIIDIINNFPEKYPALSLASYNEFSERLIGHRRFRR